MDPLSADMALHSIFGRGGDFVGGIDNEALDFSQLEAFINSDNNPASGNYFTDSLNNPQQQQTQQTLAQPAGKLLNVIVENKRTPGHSLPDSPPDSSSEHPYSPSETTDANALQQQQQSPQDAIYTTLQQANIYKPQILNPIISDNLILGSHIVVSEHGGAAAEAGGMLSQDAQILVGDERLLLAQDYDKSLMHLGYDMNLQTHQEQQVVQQQQQQQDICEQATGLDGIVYTNLQNVQSVSNASGHTKKKRKHSQENIVKNEPEHCSPGQMSPPSNVNTSVDDDYAASESCLSDSQYQCIRFQPFQQPSWHVLCDQNLSELPNPHYRVDADKGFNFSNSDDAFVCQKKNHFQITCHVQLVGDAQFVKTPEGFQKISSFHLHFYGVKHDCPTQTIRVEQSQSDRSKKPFHPVLFDRRVELLNAQVTKVTVGRLHFSETTSNNMRKKGKPNPEQRYFQLVVGLHAHTTHGNYPIVSHASQKIIVRASNPGQFESDVELCWQKGQTADSIYHSGRIGVNTDRPDESLVIHGNLKITGHIIQPSDVRAKKNIVECDSQEQLRNVQKLRVVRYDYEPGFAAQLNRAGHCDTGVIAQEVAKVIPEAVRPAGNLILENGVAIENFLVVNKERIFMENVGAVKELCKVTDNLETRIDQLERINKRLAKFKRTDSMKSSTSQAINDRRAKTTSSSYQDEQICSNKMIQIVIVVLVLVMALCLAAITTLYFLETSRHNQLTQASLQAVQRTLTTLSPPNNKKLRTWQPVIDLSTTIVYKNSINPVLDYPKPGKTLGRPADCTLEDDINASPSPCPVYCCLPSKFEKLEKLDKLDSSELGPLFDNNSQKTLPTMQTQHNLNKNKSDLINIDKNRVLKAFHSNNIDKTRQKRDDEWTDRDNGYDAIDDLHFTITMQGKYFNATLTESYLSQESTTYNYTYILPISKYMPDDYITLIFQSSQAHLKDIEYCVNSFRQHSCPWNSLNFEDAKLLRKINENVPSQLINSQSVMFDVDLIGFQSKLMTYRASLKQNQNKCKLTPTKLGIEFTEYNFLLYRHCDE
ncbi:myelin regulatory factor isoform X3 [Atheta coriaria]|uniref:myelin regulatory factor isoform X3 n=1 Tax=Dalotia coriaria TaxID=877792 RepID=UPI0031F3D4EA